AGLSVEAPGLEGTELDGLPSLDGEVAEEPFELGGAVMADVPLHSASSIDRAPGARTDASRKRKLMSFSEVGRSLSRATTSADGRRSGTGAASSTAQARRAQAIRALCEPSRARRSASSTA